MIKDDKDLEKVGVEMTNETTSKITSREQQNDAYIKAEVLNAFRWNWNMPKNSLTVKVENGCVTLSGELQWNYQREAAKSLVGNLIGVKSVINNITIIAESHLKVSKTVIERALGNHVDIDASAITVQIDSNQITLTGMVDSLSQKELAGRVAWKAPGVENVHNDLKILSK